MMKAYSKMGEIYIEPCASNADLFPLHQYPKLWRVCHDAYTYTWTKDLHEDLKALSELDKLKLAYSTGYCPHLRCQLGNSSTAELKECPSGLCYTKLENGGLSFGACCFSKDGSFISGNLVGYYNKSQTTPKPLYVDSRVVLEHKAAHSQKTSVGDFQPNEPNTHDSKMHHIDINSEALRPHSGGIDCNRAVPEVLLSDSGDRNIVLNKFSSSYLANRRPDTSWETFIHANHVADGVIAAQCPLFVSSMPEPSNTNETGTDEWSSKLSSNAESFKNSFSFVDTTQDMLQMLVEQNVTLWIQLAPNRPTSSDKVKEKLEYNKQNGNTGNNNEKFFSSWNNEIIDFEGLSKWYAQSMLNRSKCEVLPLYYASMASSLTYSSPLSRTREGDSFMKYLDVNPRTPQFEFAVTHARLNRVEKMQETLSSDFGYVSMEYDIHGYLVAEPQPTRQETSLSPSPPQSRRKPLCVDVGTSSSISAIASSTATSSRTWYTTTTDTCQSGDPYLRHTLNHVWFYDWPDFLVPDAIYDNSVRNLVQRTAEAVVKGEQIVVSCGSGRGRSGTFIAIVLAQAREIKTLSELVDITVQIRSRRDGLLELPEQFRYASRILNLHPDTRTCDMQCRMKIMAVDVRNMIVYSNIHDYIGVLLICLVFGIGCSVLGFFMGRNAYKVKNRIKRRRSRYLYESIE